MHSLILTTSCFSLHSFRFPLIIWTFCGTLTCLTRCVHLGSMGPTHKLNENV